MKYSGSPYKDFLKGINKHVTIDITDSKAIQSVMEDLKQSIVKLGKDITDVFGEELRAYGEEVCKQEVPVDTGALRDSITSSYKDGVITISAGTDHALFVEFGTGINGEMSLSFSDSGAEAYPGMNVLDWKYDYRDIGWIGHEANPFMYRTAKAMQEYAPKLLKEIMER